MNKKIASRIDAIKSKPRKRAKSFAAIARDANKKFQMGRKSGSGLKERPNKLSLLDKPLTDDEFKQQILGIYTHTDPDENAFLLSYSRWTSPLWSGPSVRMTRSYSHNAAYTLGMVKKRRKS